MDLRENITKPDYCFKIYDNGDGENLLFNHCNPHIPQRPSYISYSNKMLIRFNSDNSTDTSKGFKLKYETVLFYYF